MRIAVLAAVAAFFAIVPAQAEIGGLKARAVMKSPAGVDMGVAEFTQTPGGVYIHALFHSLTPGIHAMHVHETGLCEGPDFKSAGGHFNPDGHEHGRNAPGGPHRGDLPNFTASPEGAAEVQIFAPLLSLNEALLDQDGAALIVHAMADDYVSQPSGNAGDRMACGVLVKN